MPYRYRVLFLFLFLCLHAFVHAQTAVPARLDSIRYDSIRYDRKLHDLLFIRQDTLRDSSLFYGGLEDFFNAPIQANIEASGDCGEALLLFCRCISHHDTLLLVITGPSVCCYHELTVRMAGGLFTTTFMYSFDFSPADIHLSPVTQELILQTTNTGTGEELRGYLSFDGKGSFGESNFGEEFSKEVQRAVFSAGMKGFFKCVIEKE